MSRGMTDCKSTFRVNCGKAIARSVYSPFRVLYRVRQSKDVASLTSGIGAHQLSHLHVGRIDAQERTIDLRSPGFSVASTWLVRPGFDGGGSSSAR